MRTLMAATAVAAAALIGCTAMSVQHDYDPDVAFERYRTFAWMPLEPAETIDGGSLSAPFLDKHVRKGIVEALTARDYTYQPEGADLLVAYHLHYRRKNRVEVYGYGYGPYLYRGPRAVEVSRFREGTLVVDFVDPQSKELIWRGWSVSDVGLWSNPEKERKRLDLAVKAIIERFPPYGFRRE